MKILIYFLFVVSIFAQDSLKIESGYNTNFNVKPIIKIPVNRNWARGEITNTKNYKVSSLLNLSKKKQDFIDSDIFLIVAGSAVVFGTAAAYFKRESDNYYEKYRQNYNRGFLDKTNKYDLYSGISLGIMEINFGYLIYKFLTD